MIGDGSIEVRKLSAPGCEVELDLVPNGVRVVVREDAYFVTTHIFTPDMGDRLSIALRDYSYAARQAARALVAPVADPAEARS